MITSIFEKTKSVNFIILILVFTVMYLIKIILRIQNDQVFLIKDSLLTYFGFIVLGVLINYISKKFYVTGRNHYVLFVFLVFLLYIPSVLVDYKVTWSVIALAFVFFKLLSIKNQTRIREQLLDVSLITSFSLLFNFWNVLLIGLLYSSIILFLQKKYKFLLIPIVGFLTAQVFVYIYHVIFEINILETFSSSYFLIDFDIQNYFDSVYHNISFALVSTYFIFFLWHILFKFKKYPAEFQNHVSLFLITILFTTLIFVFSSNKSNNLMLYTMLPMSFIGANLIDSHKVRWVKELNLSLMFFIGVIMFFLS